MNCLTNIVQLPNELKSVMTNRWLFVAEHIDAFLVKAVHLPNLSINNKEKQHFSIDLFNAASHDNNAKLLYMMKNKVIFDAQLKYLDTVGNVTDHWKFDNLNIDYIEWEMLEYAHTPSPLITYVGFEFSLKDFEIVTENKAL